MIDAQCSKRSEVNSNKKPHCILMHMFPISHNACFFLQPKSLFSTSGTGIYKINDVCSHESPFLQPAKLSVRCDMETDGGGWIVIQRRVSGGTENFTKNWEAYDQGFCDLEGEFWFGLRNIHCLTTREEVELRIDMKTTSGAHINWTYQEFRVDGPVST